MHPALPLRRAFVAGVAVLASSFVFAPPARSAEFAVAQVVVTANRVPQAADTAVADLVVIDAEQIERAGPIGLAELLQRHAGAEISATGGPGQPSGVFLRGTNTSHVVVLIDGVRLNSATSGTNALEHIPLAQIDRIEVLRGPASSLYGADAIGGVIQIFTKTPDGASAGASAGSEHRGEVHGSVGRTTGPWSWSLNAGALAVDAFSATNAANAFSYNPDRDPYRNKNANGALQWRLAEGHQLSLRGSFSSADTHFDAGPASDDVNQQHLSTLALRSDNRLARNWLSTLRLARGSDHSSTHGAFPSRFDTDQDQALWQNDLAFGATELSLGAEWRREQVASSTAYTQTERTISSLFAAAQHKFDAVQLEGSVRTDHNTQFGTHTTGRVGAGWSFAPDWRLSAAAGNAFRAPSFNDLYFPLSFGFSGNPNLQPERSHGFDAALRWRRGGTTASLTAFDNRIDDLIAVDPTFSTVINVNRARIHGTTLLVQQAWGVFSADVEWTHQDPRDCGTGLLLVRRARDHGRAGVAYDSGAWRIGGDLSASGARYDSAANTPASRMGGYGLLSLYANWSITREVTLGARVANATDKRYELAQGYNTAPRQLLLTVDAAWR
ncbi:MAG TPA: TonB-dependent receptor [Burkholderiaceae bacterium]|nr:TonB-dependent receptor [Burkholderiaceae bacterium]